jgi:hypothetical protein
MAVVYATTSGLIPASTMVLKICKRTWSSHQRTDITLQFIPKNFPEAM